MLINKEMKKKDLYAIVDISIASAIEMSQVGHVTIEVLEKICSAINCTMDDIIGVIPDYFASLII